MIATRLIDSFFVERLDQEWVLLPALAVLLYPFGTAGSNDISSRGDRNRPSFSLRNPEAPAALIDSFFVERLDEKGLDVLSPEALPSICR